MSDKSAIEWTDATWNPIVGCSIVSPGCTNCYAMKQAARIQKMNPTGGSGSKYVNHYDGTTRVVNGNVVWTGKVAVAPDKLFFKPLSWKSPRRIFVNSMGDLFHESIPDEWIDRVFVVMALCPQHTFQVLTKRAARMRNYLQQVGSEKDLQRFANAAVDIADSPCAGHVADADWPLPNVWLGFSAEDQKCLDERWHAIGELAEQGWLIFCSAEPLLGPLDFTRVETIPDSYKNGRLSRCGIRINALTGKHHESGITASDYKLSWVIVGGESGPDARPMNPTWVRDIRKQCAEASVPFFFKQWGEYCPAQWPASETQEDEELREAAVVVGDRYMRRIGKKAAGRLLDGREWNEFPEAQA